MIFDGTSQVPMTRPMPCSALHPLSGGTWRTGERLPRDFHNGCIPLRECGDQRCTTRESPCQSIVSGEKLSFERLSQAKWLLPSPAPNIQAPLYSAPCNDQEAAIYARRLNDKSAAGKRNRDIRPFRPFCGTAMGKCRSGVWSEVQIPFQRGPHGNPRPACAECYR